MIRINEIDGGLMLINPSHIIYVEEAIHGHDAIRNINLSNGTVLATDETIDEIEAKILATTAPTGP